MSSELDSMSCSTRPHGQESRPASPVTSRVRLSFAIAAVVLFATASIASTSQAIAQEDAPYAGANDGELSFATSSIVAGGEVTVSGDGFAPEGPADFTFGLAEELGGLVDLILEADSDGVAAHSFTLPQDLATGLYTALMRGATPDGAPRSLVFKVLLYSANAPITTTSEAAPTISTLPTVVGTGQTAQTTIPIASTAVPIGEATDTASPPTSGETSTPPEPDGETQIASSASDTTVAPGTDSRDSAQQPSGTPEAGSAGSVAIVLGLLGFAGVATALVVLLRRRSRTGS
jgi:hypothetical protein